MTSDRLKRNAKAAYLAWSLDKYGARVPLSGHGPLVLYAHELDGCPWRTMARRAWHVKELRSLLVQPWNHNLDRGDSFEQGRGLTHGVPAGITMELVLPGDVMAKVLDRIRDKAGEDMARHVEGMVEDHGVVLSGTPDFMALEAIDGGTRLRILDAKSPRKPWRDEDGSYAMKATWRSRLETYLWLARQLYLGHDAAALAAKLREKTPWPVRPGRLQPEGNIEDVAAAVVLDTGESYEFLELHVSDHDLEEAMIEKLAKTLVVAWLLRHGYLNGFLGMSLLSDEALAWLTGVEDDERSWQCGYCLLAAACPMANNVKVVEIMAPARRQENVSKKGTRYWKYHGPAWDGKHVIDMELLTTDEELVKASLRHDVYVRVQENRVKTRSVMRPPGFRDMEPLPDPDDF